MRTHFVLAALAFFSAANAQTSVPDASLTNTYWRIDTMLGEAVSIVENRREPHFILRTGDNGGLAATAGCNRLAGTYETEGNSLSFGPIMMTRMACPPPLGEVEQRLGEMLAATQGFEIDGDSLTLFDADGSEIGTFSAVYF